MKQRTKTFATDRVQLLAWVEQVATYVAEDGTPPIAGRILGWLMVCDPAEQSAAEIAEAISASRASMTTNLRVLLAVGFVERRTQAGQRTELYRLRDNAWETVVRRQVAGLTAFRQIARNGLALVGANRARSARVHEANQVFAWLADLFERAPPLPSGRRVRLDSED